MDTAVRIRIVRIILSTENLVDHCNQRHSLNQIIVWILVPDIAIPALAKVSHHAKGAEALSTVCWYDI